MPGTVALTGATGFIGSTLRRALVAAGHDVRALTRRDSPPEHGVTWIRGDLACPEILRQLVAGTTAVIHCAGAVRGAARADFDWVNVAGTAAVVTAARSQPAPPRFLLVSSLAARQPELSWYAASKAEAEALLAREGASLRWTVLRPTAVYGPGDREMRPLFQWLLRGVLPTPQPAGARFSLLHVDDLAAAVVQWLGAPHPGNGPFEICDGTPGGYDTQALAALAAAHLGRTVRIVRLPARLLGFLAGINLLLARLTRRAPMLTPGKVREITHGDWRADAGPFMHACGWAPRIRFQDALASHRLFFT